MKIDSPYLSPSNWAKPAAVPPPLTLCCRGSRGQVRRKEKRDNNYDDEKMNTIKNLPRCRQARWTKGLPATSCHASPPLLLQRSLLEMKKETVRRRDVMKYLNESKTKNNFSYSLPSRSRHSPYITCCQQPSMKSGNHTLCRHPYRWSSQPAAATGILPLLLRRQRHCCCCFFADSCLAGGINRT